MTDKQSILLQPHLSITYTNINGKLINNTDKNIAEKVFKICLYQWFPVVNADGELKVAAHTFDLYIGRELDIETGISSFKSQELKTQLINIKKRGYKRVVIPHNLKNIQSSINMIPIKEDDRVYKSWDEAVQTITKIASTYEEINISIENQEFGTYGTR